MIRAIGFENSNSSCKGISDIKTLHYPNTIKQLRSESSTINDGLGIRLPLFEVNGKLYQVGHESGYGSGSKDDDRYGSDQFKLETAVALSQMCNNGDRLQMITGLPANLSNSKEIIDRICDSLIDSYEVKVDKAIKRFSVDKVKVISQPVGTLWSMFYDLNGRKKVSKSEMEEDYLIIDIGYGTTDIVALSAYGIDHDQTKTLDIAMGDYIKKLYTTIEQEIPESKLTAKKITPYQLDRLARDNEVIKIKGKQFDITGIKKDLQAEFAQDLKQRFDNFGYSLDAFSKIILTGGGSAIMYESILKAFNKDDLITIVDNPPLANVIGFYIMSRQLYKL